MVTLVLVAGMVLSSGSIGILVDNDKLPGPDQAIGINYIEHTTLSTAVASTLTPARDLTGEWEGTCVYYWLDLWGERDVKITATCEMSLEQNGNVVTGVFNIYPTKIEDIGEPGYVPPIQSNYRVDGIVSGTTLTFDTNNEQWKFGFTTDLLSGGVTNVDDYAYLGSDSDPNDFKLSRVSTRSPTQIQIDETGDIFNNEEGGFSQIIHWFITIIFEIFGISDEEGVEFIEHNPEVDEYGLLYIVGKLKNTEDTSISSVEIYVKYYDDEGNVLDSGFDYIDDLGPDEIWNFEIMYLGNSEDVASYKIAVSTDYSTPDSTEYGQSIPIILPSSTTVKTEQQTGMQVRGKITDKDTGNLVEGATVKVAYQDESGIDKSIIVYSEGASIDSKSNNYLMYIPYYLPENIIISVNSNGYLPMSKNVVVDASLEQEGKYRWVDFALTPTSDNVIVVDDQLHHLGDDSYSGYVNSQFQLSTEGSRYSKTFTLEEWQLEYSEAALIITTKGAQNSNQITLNGQNIGVLCCSPGDGSFGSLRWEFDTSVLKKGFNQITISSAYDQYDYDYDDFEFTDIMIELEL